MLLTYAEGGLVLEPGTIARLTLDRPERHNAMTAAMWAAFPEICDRVADDHTRVLIVTGAGGKAFCAGADISEFATVYGTPAATAAYNGNVRTAQARLRNLGCPTIAEVRGICYGGGCGLALACDLRVASAGASFAITPAKLGLAYSPADTWQLIEKVGMPRAKDLLLTGRAIEAREALDIGLVDRIEDDANALAEHLASLAPGALCAIKAICNSLSAAPTDARAQAMFEAAFAGPEFREGYSAFLEKRRPTFGKDTT